MTSRVYGVSIGVFERFPGYRRGAVIVRDTRNGPSPPALVQRLRAEESVLRQRLDGDALAGNPRIQAWRDAYRAFGAKPSEHRSSVEAMARRVVKGDALPSINALVDIGNLVSLRWLMPAGVHPLDRSEGDLWLRFAEGREVFSPPDGKPDETVPRGEVVFAEDDRVLTRRWTWRQAAGTQTLPDTRAVVFNIDALPPAIGEDLIGAGRDIEALVAEYCGGQIEFQVLDEDSSNVPL